MDLISLAEKLKSEKKQGLFPRRLQGKSIALIFEKASTRTRCSFVVAAHDEGAHAETFGLQDLHMGVKEDIKDSARVLSRFFDGIQFRGHAQATVEALALHSTVPVWNGLTDQHHPTQAIADLMTLKENFGTLKGLKICYLGDASNNTATSLMVACSMAGVHLSLSGPEDHLPGSELMGRCLHLAKESGATLELDPNPRSAAKGAHALYTDVWVSMGEEHKPYVQNKVESLKPYQVTSALMECTGKSDTIFLHCLPANKGMDVTEEVFESAASKVFDQAENRLHTIKALLLATLLPDKMN